MGPSKSEVHNTYTQIPMAPPQRERADVWHRQRLLFLLVDTLAVGTKSAHLIKGGPIRFYLTGIWSWITVILRQLASGIQAAGSCRFGS